MKILYGVQIHGQGHLNRSAAMISFLRARGHEVEVIASGQAPPSYARDSLGPFEYYEAKDFDLADGTLDVSSTAARMLRLFPRRLRQARALAERITRGRFALVLSDFEPLSAWASGFSGVPGAGIAAQYRITHTDAQALGPTSQRVPAELVIRIVAMGLEKLFAVSFAPLAPRGKRAQVVGPIVEDRVRALERRRGGFYLAYLYSYPMKRVVDALRGPTPFRVYGLGAQPSIDNIEFRETGRDAFLRDLAECDGVILNGSFQGVCEAAVLGKRVLTIPFASYYEDRFCSDQVVRAGLGQRGERLDAQTVAAFVAQTKEPLHLDLPDGREQIAMELGL